MVILGKIKRYTFLKFKVVNMESHKRSLAKTISFRIIATITTAILVLIFTNNFVLASTIGVFDFSSKLIIYYLHERTWNMLSWGINNA